MHQGIVCEINNTLLKRFARVLAEAWYCISLGNPKPPNSTAHDGCICECQAHVLEVAVLSGARR